ncbi:T9SS type A sorting domain-containing protein [Riemerella anatipestifer]|uniref:T9SS type A sorting domain-containing protein n=1 Tax=Riemerella anatipestifer TaxID=34085 RepID=UPI001AD64835|nr:T9SS type A sorting domain-containing protein [Riemerella anatipestifer]MBO4234797.1 T9SS type A sorting domain-containing protein [Riemerella anatipestifer]
MRKILFSVATIFAASFAFGQITLEHSFVSQDVIQYSDETSLKYVTFNGTQVIIYNADYSVFKTFTVTIPPNYSRAFITPFNDFSFNVSKHVFNTDDKLEFFIFFAGEYSKAGNVIIYNEDGNIIKNFNDNYTHELIEIFHDNTTNTNKLKMGKYSVGEGFLTFDIYSLPTSVLTTKEIQTKNKLSGFPIPTNKIFNVINPQNGASKIEIFDTSGKLMINKGFGNSESKISIDVENLPKGIYIYKIGDLSSKFIKN